MDFPDNCIRGISNRQSISPDGAIGSDVFGFNERPDRDDGWMEQSINWEDTPSVIEFTLNQEKAPNEKQFKAGIAIIPRSEIDRLNQRLIVNGVLGYERQRLDDNPYHGNILIQRDVSKPKMRAVAAGLALAVSRIILQD